MEIIGTDVNHEYNMQFPGVVGSDNNNRDTLNIVIHYDPSQYIGWGRAGRSGGHRSCMLNVDKHGCIRNHSVVR